MSENNYSINFSVDNGILVNSGALEVGDYALTINAFDTKNQSTSGEIYLTVLEGTIVEEEEPEEEEQTPLDEEREGREGTLLLAEYV